MSKQLLIGILIGLAFSTSTLAKKKIKSPSQSEAVHSLKLEVIIKDGTKYWIPNQLRVKKGEKVRLKLENHLTGANTIHGFRLPAYKIEALVDNSGKEVEFTADQAGTFKYDCHLHPAHVGGEFIVEIENSGEGKKEEAKK